MRQIDKMRELYRSLSGDQELVVAAYAAAERKGEVKRSSNKHGLSAETYARALFMDGTRKGWIRQEVGS